MNRPLAVFIDGKTFALGMRRVDPAARVDFARLAAWLVERTGATSLAHLTYYTGVEPNGPPQLLRFLDRLDTQPGMGTRRFPRVPRQAECSSCRGTTLFTQEKGVDTQIAVDLMGGALRREFEVAVLVGGDRDHLPAVRAVGGMGIPVYVASWRGYGMASVLPAATTGHLDLESGFEHFGTGPPGAVPPGEQPARPVLVGGEGARA